jgi:hypothetical protein
MKIVDADVVWTPNHKSNDILNRGTVRIERHASGWQRSHGDLWMPATGLGPYGLPAKGDKQLLAMFILFNTLVVRDGVKPSDAHTAFLDIDEYRRTISPDAPGAEDAA